MSVKRRRNEQELNEIRGLKRKRNSKVYEKGRGLIQEGHQTSEGGFKNTVRLRTGGGAY